MTVFVAHAPADQKVAQDLEKFLERRGHFAECDDGMTALAPVALADIVVLLVSKDFSLGPMRLRLEQRALDAWAEGRLMVVKLDNGIAPVGLRDLPAFDASSEAEREHKWNQLANLIGETLRAQPRPEPRAEAPRQSPGPTAPGDPPQKSRRGLLVPTLMAMPGIAALAIVMAVWLGERIGPRPGSWQDLLGGLNAFGARIGLPAGAGAPISAAALVLMAMSLALIVARLLTPIARPAKRSPPGQPPAQGTGQAMAEPVFVCYARANSKLVLPVIEEAKQNGKTFWLDQHNMAGAESWAGEIVKVIGGAGEVLVMCSKAAFESDHVKREIYLADRYRKKLVPVFIEDAAPPEDFEYFFAGVQALKLFETPAAERAAALQRALA